MGLFRRKSRALPEPLEALSRLPLSKLLNQVVVHFYNDGSHHIVRDLLEYFGNQPVATRARAFGRTFFLLEKYLMELGRVASSSPNAIRDFIVQRAPELKALRPFNLAFLPVGEQETELARLLLQGVLERSLPRLDKAQRDEWEPLERWLERVPDPFAWPPPITLLARQRPDRPLEWTEVLQQLESTLRGRLARRLATDALLGIYREVYEELAGSFEGIESFPVLYCMLPVELLDGARIGMIRGRRELIREHADLERAVEDLRQANEKLRHTNEEIARLRAQAERNHRLLEEVLNTVGEGILSINDEGEIITANQECSRMWGYDPLELRQMSFASLITPECMQKVLSGEGVFQDTSGHGLFGKWVEMEACRRDGTRFPVEVQARRALVREINRTTLAIRDLTYTKESELREQHLHEKLEQARRMESLGMLAGGVAHDLNNILGPLVGYPPLILEQLPADSPVRVDVEEIANSATRASAIIQDLLTMSRRGHYEFEAVDVNKLISTFVKSAEFRQRLKENPGVNLNLQLDRSFPLIKGSIPHLTKVLINLCVNAIEAMNGQGELRITTERATVKLPGQDLEGAVVLKVADQGCGIAPENLQRIFEPFFSTKKMGRSGSGLGLSVVFGVVQDLSGTLDVRSEVGKGTEFILTFPMAPRSMAREEPNDQTPVVGGTERILVIDDEPAQRKLAERILMEKGYQVSSCGSGREGLAAIQAEPIDLVVLDMIMEPGFDGLDTYRLLHRDFPHIACVIASGFSESNRVVEARALGAQAFIRKPYATDALSREVRRVLDETALIREAERIVRKLQQIPRPPPDEPASGTP
jgi:PAS domain S-box-containing protein